ncbi:hypothetical protein [Nocardia sp. NPDC057030]|uniref:hypothetical protein n=1 Tax=unclassified Nocardia TaxID=2637762 RepID=UPI003643B807
MRVVDWFGQTHRAEPWLSVIPLGEPRRGVALLRHRGGSGRADKFEQAIADIETRHGDRILPVTTEVVPVWTRISIRPTDMAGGLIAATALVHGVAVVTRNVQHFQETGAAVLDPLG